MSTPYPPDLIGYGGRLPHAHCPGEARIAMTTIQGSAAALARPLPFGYDNPAMDPAALLRPRFLPPGFHNA